MPNKELLIKTLNHETPEKTPWVPFAGVHAGKLVGYSAKEVLTDGDKLYKALLEVNKLYKPNGQPVLFDLQLEAEILGCKLKWADDAPPSVASHPYEGDEMELPSDDLIPKETDGRLPMVLDVMRRMKEAVGHDTLLYGLICGPFTLAAHLRGNDIFMDMFDDDEYVHNLLDYCARVAAQVAEYYVNAGMDVIAVVDPLISQISSNHFEEFMTEPFTSLFKKIKDMGAYSSFFVCGDATRNIEVMCHTKPDSISIDENVNLVKAKEITDKYNVALGGNIPLTTVMLLGNQLDNMKCAIDILDSIKDKKNYILAPGCDMPYDVPVENTIGVAQAAVEPDEVRKIVANYVAEDEDIEVELPDYESLKKPLIEIFTLDSETCAACTYMKGAAVAAKERYGDKFDMVEYKYTVKENIARCKKMGVPNLPSMYINGQLKFRSIVPSSDELDAAIDEALKSTGN